MFIARKGVGGLAFFLLLLLALKTNMEFGGPGGSDACYFIVLIHVDGWVIGS